MHSAALEQVRRRAVRKDVCERYKKRAFNQKYESTVPMYSQKMRKFFLTDEKSKTIYCFNHKAASSTWMALFSRLYGDEQFLKELEESHAYYR